MLPPIATSPVRSGVVTTSARGQSWQVGTLLQALALTATRDGHVRLQIGSRVVEARTDVELKPGQTLQLRVAAAGNSATSGSGPPASAPTSNASAASTTAGQGAMHFRLGDAGLWAAPGRRASRRRYWHSPRATSAVK